MAGGCALMMSAHGRELAELHGAEAQLLRERAQRVRARPEDAHLPGYINECRLHLFQPPSGLMTSRRAPAGVHECINGGYICISRLQG